MQFNFCVEDCEWGPWSDPGCIATCGASAFKTLTRQIEKIAVYGGMQCTGESTKVVNCGLKPCPGKNYITCSFS